MDADSFVTLGAFLGANFVAALSGAVFRPGEWYSAIAKPAWRPPDWLFGPAWAVLYVTIAVSGWLAVRAADSSTPLVVYAISLVFNAGWSGIFFGLRRMDWAFAWIVGLWLSIAAMIAVFAPVSSTAAWLLVPYLAWVTFAGALNWTVWRMNAPA